MNRRNVIKLLPAVFAGMLSLTLSAAEEKLPAEQIEQYRKMLPELRKYAPAEFRTFGDEEIRGAVSAARVLSDIRDAQAPKSDFVYYTVPVFSDLIRLKETYPADGKFSGELRLTATPGEYESGSFQIYPFKDQTLEFKAGDLKTKDGAVIPASALDLKVVKIWMKGQTAWFCYFADPNLREVPQLLLHDENLIKVDEQDKANYARLKTADGKEYHRWISPSRDVDTVQPSVRLKNHYQGKSFQPYLEPSFRDTAELQSVSFRNGEFKQLYATLHVPDTAAPGLYRGKIAVKSGGKTAAEIPLAVRVLPFKLPDFPKTLYHPERDFEIKLFGGTSIVRNLEENGGDMEHAVMLQKNQLRDMRAHNFGAALRASLYGGNEFAQELLRKELELRKEAGYTRQLYGGYFWIWANTTQMTRQCRFSSDLMKEIFGHTDLTIQYGDEPGPDFPRKQAGNFKTIHKYGLKFTTAGRTYLFDEAGFLYDAISSAVWPDKEAETRRYNIVNHTAVGWYACHHVGQENPAFNRRQYGILTWLSGFTMLRNHSFSIGQWNDRANDTYKPFTVFYPTYDGVIDTLSFEAFREAVDDMKYFTVLQQEALRCEKSENLETKYLGRKALMYLADLNARSADMDTVRLETINWILKMREAR